MRKVSYFPGLAMKANSVIFWKVVKRQENGSNINNQYLTRMTKIAEYHSNLKEGFISLETIGKMILKSELEYMGLKKRLGNVDNHFWKH